jgi:surface antigen
MRLAAIMAAALLATSGGAAAAGFGFLSETPLARFNVDDVKLMNGAIDRALAAGEVGTPVRWTGDGTRSSGEVTVQRAFESQGQACRDLRVVNRHRQLESAGVYTLCREGGAWRIVEIR